MASSSHYRTLEITLISAKDLKNVNLFSTLQVYAVASVSGDPRTRQRTPTDRSNRRNPNWNYLFRFAVPVDRANLSLVISLRSDRALGDRDIGEVHVPLRELDASDPKALRFVTYQVRRPSGRPQGVLNFSYKFGDPIETPAPEMAKAAEPVTAYPVGSTAGYAYPGPNAGYGLGYPPPQQAGYGYGYPPQQQAGYGYGGPAPVVQPSRKRPGMGLGGGLLGGALGGLLIGDMIGSSSGYDAGYDDGFDSGMFDF